MNDLGTELSTNIDIVNEKKKSGSTDANQYVSDLADDVKEFLHYMAEELEQAVGAMAERDEKCKQDLEKISQRLKTSESMKSQIKL